MNYFERVQEAAARAKIELIRRGVESRLLLFGGPGVQGKPIHIPTDARSEFLANRAMGDWAERTLADAIRKTRPAWRVVHYGDMDRIAAGHEGFKEFFKARAEEVRLHGKRPDLLVFSRDIAVADDVSADALVELRDTVRKAIGSIEVRSSKFEALKYMAKRMADLEKGIKGGRAAPSFTIKVEDLKVVYRWLEGHRIPEIYCQVFFDSVFAINMVSILETIGSGAGFAIENPAKNQEKATIMIPITTGSQVGAFMTIPQFEVGHRRTDLGRHDAFVIPVGGDLELDVEALERVLLG